MDNLSIRIGALQDILLCTFGVYTTICRREDVSLLETNAPDAKILSALILLDEDARRRPGNAPYEEGKQYFYSNGAGMLWNFSVLADRIYLLGPIFTDEYSISDVLRKLEQSRFSHIPKSDAAEFASRIPLVSSSRMYLCGLMLHSCLTGTASSMQNLETLGTQSSPEPTIATRDRSADYLLEQKIWSAIREGNLNYRKDLENVLPVVTVGNISGGKYLRQEKNQAIIMASVGCRVAVEGGMNPNVAYALSDQFIQRIEACDNIPDVVELTAGILDTYIRRVHEAKQRSGISAQVCDCCDYISLHPEENPDIRLLAAKYGYTPYYFSKKFKQEMGISLRSYTARQKVEKAKELLMRTTLSTADISELLGFNSQSYFGSIFKSVTGITPGAYREQGGMDFKEGSV